MIAICWEIYGESALFVDGLDTIFIIDTKGWQTRAITKPDSEKPDLYLLSRD